MGGGAEHVGTCTVGGAFQVAGWSRQIRWQQAGRAAGNTICALRTVVGMHGTMSDVSIIVGSQPLTNLPWDSTS